MCGVLRPQGVGCSCLNTPFPAFHSSRRPYRSQVVRQLRGCSQGLPSFYHEAPDHDVGFPVKPRGGAMSLSMKCIVLQKQYLLQCLVVAASVLIMAAAAFCQATASAG